MTGSLSNGFGDFVLAMTYRLGGLPRLLVLFILISAAIVLLPWYCSFLRCGNSKTAFVAMVAVLPLAVLPLTLRPQLFCYFFLALTVACLKRFRQGHERSLWILPPMFLVWVNTDGPFVIGLIALGAY